MELTVFLCLFGSESTALLFFGLMFTYFLKRVFPIYDSQGVVIKKGTITDFTKKLDLSNFNKGIYILSLNGQQKRLILN